MARNVLVEVYSTANLLNPHWRPASNYDLGTLSLQGFAKKLTVKPSQAVRSFASCQLSIEGVLTLIVRGTEYKLGKKILKSSCISIYCITTLYIVLLLRTNRRT